MTGNNMSGQCLGRTTASWNKIILFYLVFYAALGGLFYLLLFVFFLTLDTHMPKWQLEDSLIGSNPGLGFRPTPPDSNVESNLIYFDSTDPESIYYWVNTLNDFLQPYEITKTMESRNSIQDCNLNDDPFKQRIDTGRVCKVDMSMFGPCSSERDFGYSTSTPCVFLKLNKIYNWMPEVYDRSSPLPQTMDEVLRQVIKTFDEDNVRGKMIWVTCEGVSPADRVNLGPLSYYPYRGFPIHYYPFTNQPEYLPPLIALQFQHPKRSVLINIECKAWARNIIHNHDEQKGSVQFQLMID